MDLNNLYQYAKCYRCNRQYPEVTLNIEGHIHHGEKFRCLDTKSCQRVIRKLRRQKHQQHKDN